MGQPAHFFIPHTSFLFFQEVIGRRREETLMVVSQDLPAEREEETGGEIILSEGEGDSLAHQSIEEALLSWSWVLKDWWPPPSLRNGDTTLQSQ